MGQKRFDEYFAKVILEKCFPKKFNHLQIVDKPDLQNEVLGDISTFIFDVPSLGRVLFPNHKSDLTLYIDRYLEFVLRDREDTANTPERLPQEPPMDMLNRMFNFGSCELKVLNIWLMKFISSGCVAFCRHGLTEDSDAEWRQLCIEDGQIETYEDLYYDTLLMLYTTYGAIENVKSY